MGGKENCPVVVVYVGTALESHDSRTATRGGTGDPSSITTFPPRLAARLEAFALGGRTWPFSTVALRTAAIQQIRYVVIVLTSVTISRKTATIPR